MRAHFPEQRLINRDYYKTSRGKIPHPTPSYSPTVDSHRTNLGPHRSPSRLVSYQFLLFLLLWCDPLHFFFWGIVSAPIPKLRDITLSARFGQHPGRPTTVRFQMLLLLLLLLLMYIGYIF